MLLVIICASCCFYYGKYRTKQKHLLPFNGTIIKLEEIKSWKYIIKMETSDELKEINIKNCMFCYINDITKTKDFDFDNILIHDKPYKKQFWFITFHTKLWLMENHCVLDTMK